MDEDGTKPMATNPGEIDDKDKADPNRTAGDEPESGGGYGNHAPEPAADKPA